MSVPSIGTLLDFTGRTVLVTGADLRVDGGVTAGPIF